MHTTALRKEMHRQGASTTHQHNAPAKRTSKATGSYWLLAVRADCPDAAAHAARAATRGLRQGTRDNRSGDSTCAPARTCKDVWRPGACGDAQQRGLLTSMDIPRC